MESIKKPIVSIGICVRNCENSIKDVVNSVINQDYPHNSMEVIFADDGSEDRTLSIIHDCASKIDIKTKILSQGWAGLGPVRNLVISNAEGNYMIWVDGDMTLSEDYVRKQVEFLEQKYSVGIASGKYGILCPESLVAALELIGFVARDHKFGGSVNERLPGTGGSIFRMEAIKQVGGFDNNLKYAGEDIDIAYRVREAGWSVYFGTGAVFYEKGRKSLRDIWCRYLRHGYALHYVIHKDRGIEKIYEMVPPMAFLSGLIYSVIAYKLVSRRFVFLLPFFFFFKNTAWCLGLIKSHLNQYGHFR